MQHTLAVPSFNLLRRLAFVVAFFAASFAFAGAGSDRIAVENIDYVEHRKVTRYTGFNEFENSTEPVDGAFVKKYKTLTWSGSVKESGTVSILGTQRTDFTGTATFGEDGVANNLLRREFRNLGDPANEGDGSGGPYTVVGELGGCWPESHYNLLNEYPGTPGYTLHHVDSTEIVSPTRRDRFGHMALLWSRIHLPCNLFTFQTPSDTFQSKGPVTEELSEPAEGEVIVESITAGYFANPVASITYRMENNAAWSPLSTTPGLVEELAYECRLQFRLPEACAGEGPYILHLSVETWTGNGPRATQTFSQAVTPTPSPTGMDEVEAKVELRVEKLGESKRIVTAELEIQGGDCARCSSGPGASSGELGSVSWRMDLGPLPDGTTAGLVRLHAGEISPALATPAALAFFPPASVNRDQKVVRRPDQSLRQIRTGRHLLDIVTSEDDPSVGASGFELRFYAQQGSTPVAVDSDLHVPAGEPLSVTRIFDPQDALPSLAIHRHHATQTEPAIMWVYAHDPDTGTWALTEGGLRRTERRVEALSATEDNERTIVWDLRAGQPIKLSDVVEKYRRYTVNGREQRVRYEQIVDPEGEAFVSTWQYAEDARGMLRLMASSDYRGGWSTHTYQVNVLSGGLVRRFYNDNGPFVNASPSSPTSEHRTRTNYTTNTSTDLDGDGKIEREFYVYDRLGTTLHVDVTRQFTKGLLYRGRLCTVVQRARFGGAYTDINDPTTPWTREYRYTEAPFAGRVAYRLAADRTLETYEYQRDPNSGEVTEIHESGAPTADLQSVAQGRRTVTVTDPDGRLQSRVTTDLESGLTVDLEIVLERDGFGNATLVQHLDGSHEARTYNPCCGRLQSVTRHGRTATFGYDRLGHLVSEEADGLRFLYEVDALGRRLRTTRVGSDGSSVVVAESGYDLVGRRRFEKDAGGRLTTFDEEYLPDRTVRRTTTFPDGSMAVDVTNADGSANRSEGTRNALVHWDHALETRDGRPHLVTTEYRGPRGAAASEWRRTVRDGFGLVVATEFPDGASEARTYDRSHRLIRQADADGVVTLFAYNPRGEQEVVAADVNRNGEIDYAGPDRIVRTRRSYALRAGVAVERTTTEVWENEGEDTPVEASVADVAVTGLSSWQTLRGLTTHASTTFGSDGLQEERVIAPDGSTSVQLHDGQGRLVEFRRYDGAGALLETTLMRYDAHGRVETTVDSKGGETVYAYYPDDRVRSVTSPDPDATRSGPGYDPQVTTYAYDAAGRVEKVALPDGGEVHTTYWPNGQVRRTWGTRTYPTEYSYDDQGRMQTLTTWQDFANEGGQATTTWHYDPQRGWLDRKTYADGRGPTYGYTAAGRLARRTWVREGGIETTYRYNPAGDLEAIDYSDETTDVGFTHDRQGRVRSVTDDSGERVYEYHPSGRVASERYVSGAISGRSIDRTYDPLHRVDALRLPDLGYEVTYAYDAASRLQAVIAGAHRASYGYRPHESRHGTIAYTTAGEVRLQVTREYDGLERLRSIVSTPAASPAVSFAYEHNDANQRTKAVRENQTEWRYGYDALGQVTSGAKHRSDGTVYPGLDFAWTYDDIGNRRTAGRDVSSPDHRAIETYTANALNQYDARTVPGVVRVTGEANPLATVTVTYPSPDGAVHATERIGEAFAWSRTFDVSEAPHFVPLTVTGVRNDAGPNGEDVIAEESRNVFLARSPETFTYDADGNLTMDARWTYRWNGENRLVGMETAAGAAAAGAPNLRFRFAYDAQGRRFDKKVYKHVSGEWVLDAHTQFIYDDWNMIAELDALAPGTTPKTHVWGLDLSETMQGAGGVGGLLFTNLESGTHAAVFDGNGNVVGLVDMHAGQVSARYEYNPFGETVRSFGFDAIQNQIRFSSKCVDLETGLVNYVFRCYNPILGRWLNRDPIGERGGIGLYSMLANSPTDDVDFLGLSSLCHELRQLLIDSLNAKAAYEGSPAAPGYRDADLLALGIDPSRLNDDRSGFAARILMNEKAGEYVLAFRGTQATSGADWFSNIVQGAGMTPAQYQVAVNLAKEVSFVVNDRRPGGFPSGGGSLRIVGHSLGGGLASAAALATNSKATTFNAAGVHPLVISEMTLNRGDRSAINAIYVRGDPLTLFNAIPFVPNAIGVRSSVGPRRSILEAHFMDTVIENIEHDLRKNQCVDTCL